MKQYIMFVLITLSSCATLPEDYHGKIVEIYNTDGCKGVGAFTGQSNLSYNNANIEVLKKAVDAGANGFIFAGHSQGFPTMYSKLFAYKCENLSRNLPSRQQIQQQRQASQRAQEIRQQNTINALQNLGQEWSNDSQPSRYPAKIRCRTRSFNHGVGGITHTTDCQ